MPCSNEMIFTTVVLVQGASGPMMMRKRGVVLLSENLRATYQKAVVVIVRDADPSKIGNLESVSELSKP